MLESMRLGGGGTVEGKSVGFGKDGEGGEVTFLLMTNLIFLQFIDSLPSYNLTNHYTALHSVRANPIRKTWPPTSHTFWNYAAYYLTNNHICCQILVRYQWTKCLEYDIRLNFIVYASS